MPLSRVDADEVLRRGYIPSPLVRVSAGCDVAESLLRLSALDPLVSEVLADADVLGSLPSAGGVVSPLDASCAILVHWGRYLLSEAL